MLETICDILVDAYKRNWITSRDGNISIRHHDRDHFYITPSGVRKQTLQPDQFKKLQINGNIWEDISYTAISKNLMPSGEVPLHFGLQKQLGQHKDDIRVVVHLHPTYCVAAMHAGIELSELFNHFPELSRYTTVGKNVGEVPPISQCLADECFKSFNLDTDGNIDYDIIGIKGHGVVSVANTPWRAYEHIERLEHISKIILASGNY
jgi:ribulose-5-phosphate 4-epimerase/fuculose-1-phosphate aldolase